MKKSNGRHRRASISDGDRLSRPPPKFSGVSGGTYRKGARDLYASGATPPRGSLLAIARTVERVALSSWPTAGLLGNFVAMAHTEGGLSVLQLARRYRCGQTSVKRWLVSGGPVKRSTAALVVVHAIHVSHGRTAMHCTIPQHVERFLRVAASKAAAAVVAEVATMEGVSVAQLRGPSRESPLPGIRQSAMVKAAYFGATVTEIAEALNLSPAYVSKELARVHSQRGGAK